ncbi:protein LNK3 [Phalaenopsis equestris]|uniref:protein LNK3 n=1 Tax=Phalaenopsis equestris TaxID=78828 RepID=UPI0009E59C9E|nr:protein LNK3 [Phalaenopsis equestris]
MEWSHVNGSSDCMVTAELDGLEVLSPSREDWFHWGVNGFEINGFARKYNDTSEEENLANLNSDIRVPPVNQFYLCDGSNSSSPCEDGLVHDFCMRTSDDLFSDLPDFEIQTSMENMDDILLDSFSLLDQMYLENSYESMHITDSTHHPWNSRISVLEHSETLMKDLSRRKDAMNEDPNVKAPYSIDPSPISENFITSVVGEQMCIAATVLQELENVILQLDIKTRLCIRDALYRLANRAKEQHNTNLCQTGSFKDLPSCSEFSCGSSRQELSENLEPMTNKIDRAVAALMFDRPDYKLSFLKNKQTGAASG